MKKHTACIISSLLIIFLLTQCNHERKEKLEGIWQLQTLEINGTILQGNSLGDWKWEFNEEGGYLTDVAGAREKGLYTLKGNKLILKSVTVKERPEQILNIVQLDSVRLDLVSADDKNKSALHFIKIKGEGMVDND